MKVLVDTNILIDQLCNREGFAEDANRLFLLGFQKKVTLYFCPISFVNAVYVGRKYGYSKESLIHVLTAIASFCKFADHSGKVVLEALKSNWRDFEDANQFYSAEFAQLDAIVTRDKKGFESISK